MVIFLVAFVICFTVCDITMPRFCQRDEHHAAGSARKSVRRARGVRCKGVRRARARAAQGRAPRGRARAAHEVARGVAAGSAHGSAAEPGRAHSPQAERAPGSATKAGEACAMRAPSTSPNLRAGAALV